MPVRLIAQGVAPDAIDVYLEVNSFGLFFAGPHLMLGMALTLVGWQSKRGLDQMCEDSWRWQSANPRGYEDA